MSTLSNISIDLDTTLHDAASINDRPAAIPSSSSAQFSSGSIPSDLQIPSKVPMERFDSLSGLSAVVDALSNQVYAQTKPDDTTAQDAHSVLSLGSIGFKRQLSTSSSLPPPSPDSRSILSLGSLGAGRPSISAIGADDDAISIGSFSLGSNTSGIELLGGVAASTTALNTTTELALPMPSVNTVGVEKMKQISKTFGALPPAVQEMLAERVLETMMMPDVWKQQVDAVASLAGIISDAAGTASKNTPAPHAKSSTPSSSTSITNTAGDLSNSLSLAIATLGAFLTSFATNNGNDSEIAQLAASAADEARKRFPINIASGNTSSLPLVVATLVSFLSKYTAKSSINSSGNEASSSTQDNIINDSDMGIGNPTLQLTQKAYADKKPPATL